MRGGRGPVAGLPLLPFKFSNGLTDVTEAGVGDVVAEGPKEKRKLKRFDLKVPGRVMGILF